MQFPNYSEVTKYYLLSKDGETRIPTTSRVMNHASLRACSELIGQTVIIRLNTNNPTVLCDIANLCSGQRLISRLGDTLSFVQSSSHRDLIDAIGFDIDDFKLSTSRLYEVYIPNTEEPKSCPVQIDNLELTFVPFLDLTNDKIIYSKFEEKLTVEQLHKLPLNYLLSDPARCKHAFSSPELNFVDLNLLGCAVIKMAEQENLFSQSGKGDIPLFTDEYENLPKFNCKAFEQSPYKLSEDGIQTIAVGKERKSKFPNYKSLLWKAKEFVNHNEVVKEFLEGGHGVVMGASLVPAAVNSYSDALWMGAVASDATSNSIHLCLKTKEHLKDALPLFADYKRTDELDQQRIKFTRDYCRSIIVHIPSISHIHYIACFPYSVFRMFYDGKQVYMTSTCMFALVSDYVMLESEKCDMETICWLLHTGFSFNKEELVSVPNPNKCRLNYSSFVYTKYSNSDYYEGPDAEGYVNYSMSSYELINE